MEEMIHSRLTWVLAPLNNHLFAFPPRMSTRQCVSTLLSIVKGRKAVAIFLDIEKTFELASLISILAALANKGVSGSLLRLIRDFLDKRSAGVRFQGHTSPSAEMETGTPQGSILSILLFNILVEGIVDTPTAPNVKILSYTDDITVIATGPHHRG